VSEQKLSNEDRDRAAEAVDAAMNMETDDYGKMLYAVVDAVADVLTKDAVVLSKADAKWLCDVIHGEPDADPCGLTRYDRAHKLLEP
jgi:hypothetical protein